MGQLKLLEMKRKDKETKKNNNNEHAEKVQTLINLS